MGRVEVCLELELGREAQGLLRRGLRDHPRDDARVRALLEGAEVQLRAALRDGPGFAALLRRLARTMPSAVDRLADRLQAWLLAEEVVACLAPGVPVDMPDSPPAWRQAVRHLLAGTPVPPTGGGAPAATDGAPIAAAAEARPDDRAALLAWLGAGDGPLPQHLVRLFVALADAGDPALDAALRAALARPAARRRWAGTLPEEALARVLQRLAPAQARLLLAAMAALSDAWRQVAAPGPSQPGTPWALLLAALAEPGGVRTRALVGRIAEALADGDAPVLARIKAQALAAARSSGSPGVVALFQPAGRPDEPPPAPRPAAQAEPADAVYIANAGLVLFNPFLPVFFERLGVLSRAPGKPRIAGLEAASRAAHLLQYLVDQRCDRPEHGLLLNKLLSGTAPADPLLPAIEPGAGETELCAGMTRALIGNWPAIRDAAPDGVRETFLQREGRLTRGPGRWDLLVQRRTVDVLTDLIPWNRSVVFHPWMAEAVHVTW